MRLGIVPFPMFTSAGSLCFAEEETFDWLDFRTRGMQVYREFLVGHFCVAIDSALRQIADRRGARTCQVKMRVWEFREEENSDSKNRDAFSVMTDGLAQ